MIWATNIAVEKSGKKRVKWAIFRWQKSLRFGSDGKRKRVTGNIALERGEGWQKEEVQKCTGQKCTKHQLVLLNIFKFSGSKNANKS